jgi:ketosteroid isomerase-like protein
MRDARDLIRHGIERWNAHDRSGFLETFDESIVLVDMATGQELIGREAVGRGFYDLWTVAYPDNQLKETSILVDGDVVCFEARFVGTNTGVFRAVGGEMPPTGRAIDAPFVYIAEIRDGKARRARHYYDRLLALEQEGVLTVDKLFAQLAVA